MKSSTPKNSLGALVWDDAKMTARAVRLLSIELYTHDLDPNTLIISSIYQGREEIEADLKAALKKVRACKVVLLFGTDVTNAILNRGIARIYGLKLSSPLLPGVVLVPSPHPADVPVQVLGEFRHALDIAQKAFHRK